MKLEAKQRMEAAIIYENFDEDSLEEFIFELVGLRTQITDLQAENKRLAMGLKQVFKLGKIIEVDPDCYRIEFRVSRALYDDLTAPGAEKGGK